jgi:hypothetical protein
MIEFTPSLGDNLAQKLYNGQALPPKLRQLVALLPTRYEGCDFLFLFSIGG